MAKPNYSFEKRQRELAKKKKKEEKLQKKTASKEGGTDAGTDVDNGAPATPAPAPTEDTQAS